MGFLRIANSDARSSFSRQQLGRFMPVAKWLLASVAIWLLTVGETQRDSGFTRGIWTTRADQRAVAGRARVRCGAARKDQRACRAEERPARNFTSAGGPEERK